MKLPQYIVFRLRMKDLRTIEVEPVEDPDVVAVTRCRDCAFGEIDDPDFPDQYLCNYNGCDWNKGDHYCSYGKRKEQTSVRI